MTKHKLIQQQGGGNGRPRVLIPIVKTIDSENGTQIKNEPASTADQCKNDAGPVSRTNGTNIKTEHAYKEDRTETEVCSSGDEPIGQLGFGDSLDHAREKDQLSPPTRGDAARRWFETEFWPLYPRKVAKKKAQAAFTKCASSTEIKDRILSALKAQIPGLIKNGIEFCPYPASWLSQGRHQDELSQTTDTTDFSYPKRAGESIYSKWTPPAAVQNG